MRFERLNGEAVSVWLGRKIVGLIFPLKLSFRFIPKKQTPALSKYFQTWL